MIELSAASKKSLARILSVIRKKKKFLCSSHVRADGDGLGSALAFNRLLRKMGKESHVVCELGAVPEYRFIPESETVGASPADLRPPYDALLTFDCASFERLGSIGAALPPDLARVNVDHHVSNTRFGSINWVDASFASTTEMVYMAARAALKKIDPVMAAQIYTGLVTDTGHFAFSNTTVRSHQIATELLRAGVRPSEITEGLDRQKSLAQLRLLSRLIESVRLSDDGRVGWAVLTKKIKEEAGYWPNETQEYINLIRSIKGVRVAVLLSEIREDPRIRVSWRTSEEVDGSKLAALFGGGGHMRASGALIDLPIARAEQDVVSKTIEFVKGLIH